MARTQLVPSAQLQRLSTSHLDHYKAILKQGCSTWRHNQVIKSLAAALESKINAINCLPLRATNPIKAPTLILEQACANYSPGDARLAF